MLHLEPFRGLRPRPELAAKVMAPPYDVLSSAEARDAAADNPLSFLHVSKPEIDLEPGVSPYDQSVYARGGRNFRQLIDQGTLQRDARDSFYLYRMTASDHAQLGLVATAAVSDYLSNLVRKHEHTRPDKETDRVNHMQALGAQTGPVLCVYDDARADTATLIELAEQSDPVYADLPLGDVRHSLWKVDGDEAVGHVRAAFASLDVCYIADGHHRSAAAARVAARHAEDPDHLAHRFLVVLFPASQTRILDYNRVVRDLAGMSDAEFLHRLEQSFAVLPEAAPVRPHQRGEFGLYLNGHWYRLHCRLDPATLADPVERLDVALLAHQLLEPLLNIHDPRRDPRIDFVGGGRGLGELERRVDSGEMAAAFALFPTPIGDLMSVADAGRVMPPKSTWFEPKLADGLVSNVI